MSWNLYCSVECVAYVFMRKCIVGVWCLGVCRFSGPFLHSKNQISTFPFPISLGKLGFSWIVIFSWLIIHPCCNLRSAPDTNASGKKKFSRITPHFVYRFLSYRGLFVIRSVHLLIYFQPKIYSLKAMNHSEVRKPRKVVCLQSLKHRLLKILSDYQVKT